jgi:hypothetical protein
MIARKKIPGESWVIKEVQTAAFWGIIYDKFLKSLSITILGYHHSKIPSPKASTGRTY